MATLSVLSALIAEEAGGHGFTRPLPMSPAIFGLIGLAVVFLALGFLWFFRRAAPEPVDHAHGHGEHVPGGHGHAGHGQNVQSRHGAPADQTLGGHH